MRGGGQLTRKYINDASKLTAAFVLYDVDIRISNICLGNNLFFFITLLYCYFVTTVFKILLNPIQDKGGGCGGKKVPPTCFSHVTSTNVRINPKNILTFSFNLFPTLV